MSRRGITSEAYHNRQRERLSRMGMGHGIPCVECGRPQPYGTLKEHMVEVHGYQRFGHQVLKRHQCRCCDKPGLYVLALRKYEGMVFCKEHLGLLQAKLEENRKAQELKQSAKERQVKAQDRKLAAQARFHETKKKGVR